jgi:hypothetical protein
MPQTPQFTPYWFLARTGSDRPALSHAVELPHDHQALCGVWVDQWSKYFIDQPLEMFSCKHCKAVAAVRNDPLMHPAPSDHRSRAEVKHLRLAR